MAVTLFDKYAPKLAQYYTHESYIQPRVKGEFEFTGVKTLKIPFIITQELGDYSRTGTSNRYGTPAELQDAFQEVSVSKDRSFSIVIDKGNYKQQGLLKQSGVVMAAEIKEKVQPEVDQYALQQYARNAGKTLAFSAAVSTSNIIKMLQDVGVAFDNAHIPTNDRWLFIKNTNLALAKRADEFKYADSQVTEKLTNGRFTKFDTLNVVGMPDTWFPTNVEMVAFQSKSVLLPFVIRDSKVHEDPPGFSGALLEGRFTYDAFVVGPYCDGVIAVVGNGYKTAAPTATKGATTTSLASTTNSGTVTIKYTLDGTDPRWSSTAETYSAAFDNPAADTIIKAVAYYFNGATCYYMSDMLTHTCV